MPFRPDRIGSVPIIAATDSVNVPELPDHYFDPGDPKVINVRQIDGNELAIIHEAVNKRDLRTALADAILSGTNKDITATARAATGHSADAIMPGYVRKLETVRLGIVSDAPIDDAHVAEIGEMYPMVLERLFNAISRLTGIGASAEKKPASSTPTPASKPV